MAWTLTASTSWSGGSNGGGASSAIDTTGADLIVVSVAWYTNNGAITSNSFTDSASNTWTALTKRLGGSGAAEVATQLFYAHAPTTSATHTFTIATAGSSFSAASVMAFSGSVSSPFDVENGAGGSAETSQSPGSLTPSLTNELIVSGVSPADPVTGLTLSGYTTTTILGVSSNNVGSGLGYKTQTSVATETPNWSWTTSTYAASTIASFKSPSSGGGGGGGSKRTQRMHLMGVN